MMLSLYALVAELLELVGPGSVLEACRDGGEAWERLVGGDERVAE